MQVTKALLVKFIENRCSRKEAELVYDYLMNNPHALNELLNEADWEAYNSNGVVEKQRSEHWFAAIQQQKGNGNIITLKKVLRFSAAAVVLLTVSLGAYQFIKPAGEKTAPLVTIVRPETKPPATKQKRFVNSGSKPATYTLTDGSEITLYKNSILECNQPFDSSKRDLVLHGEALFKVAKDKTKPFTVYTDDFSTTALGTEFTIRAYYEQRQSSVKLLSGKVVVKNLQIAADPVYMNPGDECFFKADHKTLELHTIKTMSVSKPVMQYEQAVVETEEAIVFSNAPLQQVFNKISGLYHIIIRVEGKQLENRKFTGTHLKSDPPDDLLSTIAWLNNLQLTKEGNDFLLQYNE
ncbi:MULTISPECIES: FecR family protein [Niastella]|uniref:FecR family protein n=1 Tax=Niastella soli TaxID=2821487 RepID=A0ABS3Z4T9_9BACT|nr:FecR family protein [Niastella soli]MBO9205169.1 FecR family protein [Niastella soli]